MKIRTICIVLVLLSLLQIRLAYAHGDSETLTQIVDNYKVELEYSAGAIKQGEFNVYTIHLFDKNTNAQLKFDSVFVKFVKDGNIVLSGSILADPNKDGGTAEVGTRLGESGTYQARVTVFYNKKALPEVAFDLEIQSGAMGAAVQKEGNQTKNTGYKVLAAALIGFGLGIVLKRSLSHNVG